MVQGLISRTDPANVMWESGLQITAETHGKASVSLQNCPSKRSKSAQLLYIEAKPSLILILDPTAAARS